MFNRVTKKLLVLGLFASGLFLSTPAQAQFGDIGAFLKAGAEDATILTKEYLRPFPTGFGTGLNAGFTEGAAPKKMLGFSIQIRPSLAIVPSSAQEFDISTLGLTNIRAANPNDTITPTISGESKTGPELIIEDNSGNELSRFNMPKGVGIPVVPAPIVQASVGLIRSTDITLRYLPETSVGDFGDFSILGGAIKHGINQYIPAGKLLPVDISVMVGFNKITANSNLDVKPTTGAIANDPSNPGDFSDQAVKTSTNTFVVNALVGKSLPFISVYGGLGFQQATFELDIEGDYPVDLPFNRYDVITDPVSFSLDSESSLHALAGFRLRLGVLAIYAEATAANYFTANAGVGISFR